MIDEYRLRVLLYTLDIYETDLGDIYRIHRELHIWQVVGPGEAARAALPAEGIEGGRHGAARAENPLSKQTAVRARAARADQPGSAGEATPRS